MEANNFSVIEEAAFLFVLLNNIILYTFNQKIPKISFLACCFLRKSLRIFSMLVSSCYLIFCDLFLSKLSLKRLLVKVCLKKVIL